MPWPLRRCASALQHTRPLLCEIGLGGSAAGTGLNTAPGYAERAAKELARLTHEPIVPAKDLAAAMQSMGDLQQLSNAIRLLALNSRASPTTCACWPPARVPAWAKLCCRCNRGSSIMPGKVNPVMFEMLNQVCYQVLGQDHAVALMAQAGQLELNVMMPALGARCSTPWTGSRTQ